MIVVVLAGADDTNRILGTDRSNEIRSVCVMSHSGSRSGFVHDSLELPPVIFCITMRSSK